MKVGTRVNVKKLNVNELLSKVLDHYASVKFRKYKSMTRNIARILSKTPPISEVFSFGYPFYGKVNPAYKIIQALTRAPHLLSNEEFLARILPDIDLILVFKTKTAQVISKNCEETFRDAFVAEALARKKKWNELTRQLEEKHKISFGVKPIEEFMEGKVRLDNYPVPEAIWRKIPLLSTPADIEVLPMTRRLLLCTAYPLTAKGLHRVPKQFRRNYLLNLLKKAPASESELLNTIAAGHPRRVFLEAFPSAKDFFTRLWKGILSEVKKQGLVEMKEGKIALSKRGLQYVDGLNAEREKFLKSGSR